MVDRYIVEVRGFKPPSLYALEYKMVAEVSEDRATRFDHEEAVRVAKDQKRVRPGHKIVIKRVEK